MQPTNSEQSARNLTLKLPANRRKQAGPNLQTSRKIIAFIRHHSCPVGCAGCGVVGGAQECFETCTSKALFLSHAECVRNERKNKKKRFQGNRTCPFFFSLLSQIRDTSNVRRFSFYFFLSHSHSFRFAFSSVPFSVQNQKHVSLKANSIVMFCKNTETIVLYGFAFPTGQRTNVSTVQRLKSWPTWPLRAANSKAFFLHSTRM